MPADITDPSGIEYALESKKGPSEENALALCRESIRHSASHIMAEAVRSIFPEAKFAIGPPTEDGFYYDFQLPERPHRRRPPRHREEDGRDRRCRPPLSAHPGIPPPRLGTCSKTSLSSWR